MNSLFIITLIPLLMVNGFTQWRFINRSKIFSYNHYFGSEYDIEERMDENHQFYSENIISNESKNTEIQNIYINMRKYNLLNRLLSNLKMEKEVILKDLDHLGIDISKLDEEDEDKDENEAKK